MKAFHDDPALKDFVIGQLALHREADKLVKGTYWEHGKGCAVGCTLEAVRLRNGEGARIAHSAHELYERHLGIPRILAYLEDWIFERLLKEDSQRWPERFISAIAPGADLTLVWPHFALWLLAEELPPRAAKRPDCVAALAEVAALYRERCETGKNPDPERWWAARDKALTARAAYTSAAYTYAASVYAASASAAAAAASAASVYAAAASASAAAASAAAASAASASAAAASAWQRAYDDAIRRQADKLIELLSANNRS